MSLTRRQFLAAIGGAACLTGCSTLGIESKFEGESKSLHKAAREAFNSERYSVVDGVLYVAMPRLDEVLTERNISLPKWTFPNLSIGERLEIRYPGEAETRKPKIAGDGTIDTPYGERVSIFENPTISDLDRALTLLAQQHVGKDAEVEVDLTDPNQLSGPINSFHGTAIYHELRDGKLYSGVHAFTGVPVPLGKFLDLYSLGEESDYVAVMIPAGNGSDVKSVFAVAETQKSRMLMNGHSMLLGNNYVVMPLGKNNWKEFRRFLQQVGGLGSDIKGITTAVNGTIDDLNKIESGYKTLTGNVDHPPKDYLGDAVKNTGSVNQLIGNVRTFEGYFKP